MSWGAMRGLVLKVSIGGAMLLGGFLTLGIVSAAMEKRNLVKYGKQCITCKGKGFYVCKLCKGTGTVKWSPLHDPVAINPCLCPTCDGNLIQRCLNCRGFRFT